MSHVSDALALRVLNVEHCGFETCYPSSNRGVGAACLDNHGIVHWVALATFELRPRQQDVGTKKRWYSQCCAKLDFIAPEAVAQGNYSDVTCVGCLGRKGHEI